MSSRKVIIAPLNWGLGHATRCIPIIKELLEQNFEPIIASDGEALALLKKEFPKLTAIELPSYKITYPKRGRFFKLKLIQNLPNIVWAMFKENLLAKKLAREYKVCGIISDNRLGFFTSSVPCVFITHQLNVLSGTSSKISTFLHMRIVKKYKECWVPDVATSPNLSGVLGHISDRSDIKIHYLGAISRFKKIETEKKYDFMVLLSGPEPQRTYLEVALMLQLQSENKKNILFVKGKIESTQTVNQEGNITYYNYMTADQLELAIQQSKFVVCRSGYTTVLDLAKLGQRAYFIPTPGQYEQEYLAKKYQDEGLAPFVDQENLDSSKFNSVLQYRGFDSFDHEINWNQLFRIFSV